MDHPVFFEKSADFGQEKKKRGKNQLILAQKSTIFYCTPCIFWKISWFSKKKAIRDGAYQFESSSETVQVSGETSSETVLINLKAHGRRCKSLMIPHQRQWNFKKFEFPAKNRLIFWEKVHQRRCLSIWKLIRDGTSLWWNLIGDGAYQFESSSETVQVSGETSSETVEL